MAVAVVAVECHMMQWVGLVQEIENNNNKRDPEPQQNKKSRKRSRTPTTKIQNIYDNGPALPKEQVGTGP